MIIGFLFLQFDITLLKKRALKLFDEAFRFPAWEAALWGGLVVLAAMGARAHGGQIIVAVSFLVAAVYFLRRKAFLELVRGSAEHAGATDEVLELALSTFSIMAVWFLGITVFELAMEVINEILHRPHNELGSLLLFSEVSSVLLIILIYRAVRRQKNLKFFRVLGLETKGLGFWKVWALPAFFALVYALITTKILGNRPIQPITPLQDLLNSTTSLGVLLLFVATAILTAPFFEEIIFRGFFFYIIRPFKGAVFAIVFVAMVFGLLHVEQYWGDWGAIAVVGCFGLALTLLRAWTGSSVPGMVAHYVYNASLTFFPVIMVIFANPVYFDYELNYYRLTDVQKEQCLLKSISRYPEFSNSYNDLAWLYSQENSRLDQALELINKALALEPDHYAFLDTKAEIFFKMGRVEDAIAVEEALTRKYPNDDYLKRQMEKFHKAILRDRISTEITVLP